MSRKKTSKTTVKSQPNHEKGSNRALYDQIDHFKQEAKQLEKEKNKIQNELDRKNGEFIKLEAEVNNLIKQKTKINEDNQALQKEINKLNIEVTEKCQKIIEVEQENNKIIDKQEHLKLQLFNAQEHVLISSEDVQAKKSEILSLISKLEMSEQANKSKELLLNETQKELERERTARENLKEHLEKAKEIVERLTEDLIKANKEQDKVNRELRTIYTDLERSRKDYQALYALQVQTESEKDQTRIDERWRILEMLGAILARSHRTSVTEQDPQERFNQFQRQIIRAVGDSANDKAIFFPDTNSETIELTLDKQSLEQLVEWYDWAPALPFEKSSGVKSQLFRLLHPGIQLGEQVLIRARLEPILAEEIGTKPIEDL